MQGEVICGWPVCNGWFGGCVMSFWLRLIILICTQVYGASLRCCGKVH